MDLLLYILSLHFCAGASAWWAGHCSIQLQLSMAAKRASVGTTDNTGSDKKHKPAAGTEVNGESAPGSGGAAAASGAAETPNARGDDTNTHARPKKQTVLMIDSAQPFRPTAWKTSYRGKLRVCGLTLTTCFATCRTNSHRSCMMTSLSNCVTHWRSHGAHPLRTPQSVQPAAQRGDQRLSWNL